MGYINAEAAWRVGERTEWTEIPHPQHVGIIPGRNHQVGSANTCDREKCSIEPEEMRPTLPNGSTLRATVSAGQSSCSAKTTTDDGETVGKMVDYGLTLILSVEQRRAIAAGFATLRPNEQTLNQCLGYISYCPLFLHMELKKTQSNRDPEVQLAIWALGGLRKMLHHGWATHMPMPAIAINGHKWDCYVFFETNKNLVGRFSSHHTYLLASSLTCRSFRSCLDPTPWVLPLSSVVSGASSII